MKIIHICLSGLYMDGWGYQDNMLAKYHKKAGHDVYVIANQFMYDKEGNYVKIDGVSHKQPDVDINGVKIVRLALTNQNRQLHGPAERVHYCGLYESLTDINPDVIFLHNPQILDTKDIAKYMKEVSNGTSFNCIDKQPKEVRLYVDSHSDYSNSGRNFLSKHILHGMLWKSKVDLLKPYTRKFYGVLPARVDFILDRYKTPADKTELLVMGMDDELADKAKSEDVIKSIRDKYGIAEDDFLIVTGGKIDHAKRQTINLLQAVKAIPNSKLKLIVFGSIVDDMKEQVLSLCDKVCDGVNTSEAQAQTMACDASGKKLAGANFEDAKIMYIGWLDSDDTYPYFAAADLAVFPGRHSVMWEQVAGQGIPMVVKYWDGTTHVDLGGNTLFLHEDSTDEIKRVIESLMNKGEAYQKMKEVAVTKGAETFSYRQLAKRCIEE